VRLWRYLKYWKNVECGCTSTNLYLSNGTKLVSQLQLLHSDMTFTNCLSKSVTDKKTNKKTKKNQTFCSPGGVWSPTPTKLGTVIEEVPLEKLLGENAPCMVKSLWSTPLCQILPKLVQRDAQAGWKKLILGPWVIAIPTLVLRAGGKKKIELFAPLAACEVQAAPNLAWW